MQRLDSIIQIFYAVSYFKVPKYLSNSIVSRKVFDNEHYMYIAQNTINLHNK